MLNISSLPLLFSALRRSLFVGATALFLALYAASAEAADSCGCLCCLRGVVFSRVATDSQPSWTSGISCGGDDDAEESGLQRTAAHVALAQLCGPGHEQSDVVVLDVTSRVLKAHGIPSSLARLPSCQKHHSNSRSCGLRRRPPVPPSEVAEGLGKLRGVRRWPLGALKATRRTPLKANECRGSPCKRRKVVLKTI